jgi:hypothetical protein
MDAPGRTAERFHYITRKRKESAFDKWRLQAPHPSGAENGRW